MHYHWTLSNCQPSTRSHLLARPCHKTHSELLSGGACLLPSAMKSAATKHLNLVAVFKKPQNVQATSIMTSNASRNLDLSLVPQVLLHSIKQSTMIITNVWQSMFENPKNRRRLGLSQRPKWMQRYRHSRQQPNARLVAQYASWSRHNILSNPHMLVQGSNQKNLPPGFVSGLLHVHSAGCIYHT